MNTFGYANEIDNIKYRKELVEMAKWIIKDEEKRIKELEEKLEGKITMNFITRITYYGDNVFFKQYYFQCKNNSPTKEQVINAIEELHNEYEQYPEYYGEEYEALEIIKLVPDEDWQFVSPDSLVSINTFIEHPKFSKQSFSWNIINLIDVES